MKKVYKYQKSVYICIRNQNKNKMNFLQLLKAKTEKLLNTESVKLACIESLKLGCTIAKTGVIVPQSEIIKIENGFVYISGANAYNYSRQEALSQITI